MNFQSSLRRACVLTLLSINFAPAQMAPAAPTTQNSAVVPFLAPSFVNKHAANVEIAKKGDIDLLFMGDSITDFWRNDHPPKSRHPSTAPEIPGSRMGKPVFDKYFGAMKTANFGISGDSTQGVLYRLQNGEGQGFSPKVVMLMIGTNNTGRNTAEEIADGVTADVNELRKDFPDAKILLLAIFPRADNPDRQHEIEQINPIIARLDDQKHIFYMDINSKFFDADGKIPVEIMSDGLHPTVKGYEVWAQAVIESIKKLMQ